MTATRETRIQIVLEQLPNLIEQTGDDANWISHDSLVGELKMRGLDLDGTWIQREQAIRCALLRMGFERRRLTNGGRRVWRGVRWRIRDETA